VKILRLFTGEFSPKHKANLKDSRRMFFNEMTTKEQKKAVKFFLKK